MVQLDGKKVHIDGKFAGLRVQEVVLLLIAHGALNENSNAAEILLTGDPMSAKAQKLRAKGLALITLDDLGPPLASWFDRLQARVALQQTGKNKKDIRNWASRPGVEDALLARIAERVGFALPPELVHLARSFDGLSFLQVRSGKTISIPPDQLLGMSLLGFQHPVWKTFTRNTLSIINILPWEEVFFGKNPFQSTPSSGQTVTVGGTTLTEVEFNQRIFPFDLYHWNEPALLFADPRQKMLFVLHTGDHGADWTVSEPIPLRLYMESLLGDRRMPYPGSGRPLSKHDIGKPPGHSRYWRPRPETPTSKKQNTWPRRWAEAR